MRLIIQIPCYNEEETIGQTLEDLPKKIKGVDRLEILIIDDGSTDKTIRIAEEHGVNHIVKFTNNKGLARAFMAGIDASLKLGANIIVNTDADNQYQGEDIAKLIDPILKGKADMVVGERDIAGIEHFSPLKKKLQKAGSWVVRQVSNTEIPDATSGFRAYAREAALQLNVISSYSYTLETIIQAGKKNIALDHAAIGTNSKLRESRLSTGIFNYVKWSAATILRIYTMYEPLKLFLGLGAVFCGAGLSLGLYFLYYRFYENAPGHGQSLILSVSLLIVGFAIMIFGLLADLISANRRLIEDTLYRVKKIEMHFGDEKDS
ncbi:glycosyltransferase family 2 protein [Acidobacteriota bacterium]